MIAIVPIYSWKPPKLTKQEEIEYGRKIAELGKECFIKEFQRSFGGERISFREYWLTRTKGQKVWFAFGWMLLIFGIIDVPGHVWMFMLYGAGAVTMVAGTSIYLANRRFTNWLDSLVEKYAAHTARTEVR